MTAASAPTPSSASPATNWEAANTEIETLVSMHSHLGSPEDWAIAVLKGDKIGGRDF